VDKLGLIILAGGLSSRMGQPKALLPWVNGESLISHALRKGLEADVDDIIISIGDDDQLGHAIQTHIIDTLSNDEKKKVSIVLDDIVHFSDTPATLLTLKNKRSREDSDIKSEFIKNFPFLKRQMGEYKYDLFCSVERDNKVQWPNSIELTISELLEPIVSEVACKIELIKK